MRWMSQIGDLSSTENIERFTDKKRISLYPRVGVRCLAKNFSFPAQQTHGSLSFFSANDQKQ
jgi:hypothetical protein